MSKLKISIMLYAYHFSKESWRTCANSSMWGGMTDMRTISVLSLTNLNMEEKLSQGLVF